MTDEQRERLRELVRKCWREAWEDGHAAREAAFAWEPTWDEAAGWAESEAAQLLEELAGGEG